MLAVGLLLLVLAAAWSVVGAPLLAWHAEWTERIEQKQRLAQRMARLAAALPGLQQAAQENAATGPGAAALLEGATDAVAAAALQERLQAMAAQAGAALGSIETVAPTDAGAYRRIGLHVSLRATWPALVRLLQAIEQAAPRMLVDDMQVRGVRVLGMAGDQPLDAGFTVVAFRAAAAAPPGTPPARP